MTEETVQSDHSIHRRRNVDSQIATEPIYQDQEYRQLFRLPPEEALVQDFNCALQENILLQGHLYLFVHHICFYSNIFGFETKKTISYHEVTYVRKAKTVGIFPNAIEIVAGEKKLFFTSFWSRDEAYRFILDGWSQHSNNAKAILDQQETKSDTSSQDNDSNSVDRPVFNHEDDATVATNLSEEQLNAEASPLLDNDHLVLECSLSWKLEDACAPNVPESCTLVAESKFPINTKEFFSLYFSNNAIDFVESFHRKCGDKDFRCTPWHMHEQFGLARDMSFRHPIKIYLGAKLGLCQEIQKFRVYKNSHLIIETSQQINDVPYGDYFCVEGLWSVEPDCVEGVSYCNLRVYTNVSFCKKTMWRGKIEQSTIDECREAYSIWISNAHELLKQKLIREGKCAKFEDSTGIERLAINSLQNNELQFHKDKGQSKKIDSRAFARIQDKSHEDVQLLNGYSVRDSSNPQSFSSFLLRKAWTTFSLHLINQSHSALLLAIGFLAILVLVQLSVILRLSSTRESALFSHGNCMTNPNGDGTYALYSLEKRATFLKDELLMFETHLERMRHEYLLLRDHLQNLEKFKSKS